MSYQEVPNTNAIRRIADNTSIPADPKNQDYAEYLKWRALGNSLAPYVAPPETDDEKQAKKNVVLAAIDNNSVRSLRELVLDLAGIIALSGAQRIAARTRLKTENDKADLERAK